MDIEKLLYDNPLDFYEYILKGPLTQVYSGKKKTKISSNMNYSNLLIDKFAIHSSSFYHLSNGFIEHKGSTDKVKIMGYDLFTVNAIFRVIIETYITFNHIFVEPKNDDEKQFRFYLWKLDGLFEKRKFKINYDDLPNLKEIEENNKKEIEDIHKSIVNNSIYNSLDESELLKIYNPEKRKSLWKFSISENNKVRPLNISELIELTLKIEAFTNTYKYTSVHTHSGFIAIEHFEQTRSKIISEDYTDPLVRLAIYLTVLMIYDISEIDQNGKNEFLSLPEGVKNFINGINSSIRK